MKTLTVTLADLEGLPHGTTRTSVKVSARYSRDVVLADGTIIPPVIRTRPLGTGGQVEFDVYASDDPLVKAEYREFAVVVTAEITGLRGGSSLSGSGRAQRTVKVPSSSPSTVALGALPPAEPVPPQWATVGEVIADFDARLDALEARPHVTASTPEPGVVRLSW